MLGNIVKLVVGIGAILQLIAGGTITFIGLPTSTGGIQSGMLVVAFGVFIMFIAIFTLVGISQLHERKR